MNKQINHNQDINQNSQYLQTTDAESLAPLAPFPCITGTKSQSWLQKYNIFSRKPKN